jgi:hypothetical protein
MDDFKNHPLAKKITRLGARSNWKQVANEINIEFRRVDKFTSGSSIYNRIYLTDNWLIKVNLYSLEICQNDNINLYLTHSIELNLTVDGSPTTQLLKILVKPQQNENALPSFKEFYLKLNSLEFKDFNDQLCKPIEQTNDVIIKQSLPDQFLDSFREQVVLNGKYRLKREVKILKLIYNSARDFLTDETFLKTSLGGFKSVSKHLATF